MSKLEVALGLARQGYKVFPLVANGKTPAFDSTWYEDSTTNLDTIRAMWMNGMMQYNIGINTTGFVVCDIDVKEGKRGVEEYAAYGGHYDTYTVRTPSGGYHCYFEGPDSSNVSLSKAVDIRSHHGYVVAPGSTIDGTSYEIVVQAPVAPIPESIKRQLVAPHAARQTDTVAVDSPAMIDAGIGFLLHTPVAVEGENGDLTTFTTAARLVREMALSEDTAFALLRDHWNPRCEPPWELDELYRKVQNAAQYGTAVNARLDPSVTYGHLDIQPPPSMFAEIQFGNALLPTALAPRPWICDRILMAREVSLLVAPGSAGKSSLALVIACHLALGKDFGPYKMRVAAKSIVYNGEDNRMEMSRRLYAICATYMLDYAEVSKHLLLISDEDINLKLATSEGRRALRNNVAVDQLIDLAANPEVGMIVLDPLGDLHDVDETDNPGMNTVMQIVKYVSREANVATLILHHTSKGGGRADDRAGNMDIARGASAIVNKARISFTLLPCTHNDADMYGIRDEERQMYVRLDDAKMNLSLASANATWFHKEGVKIISGDIVGVLKHVDMTANKNAMRNRIGNLLIDVMIVNATGEMQIAQAVAVLKTGEPLWANKSDKEVKDRVEAMFVSPVEINGKKLQVTRETVGKTHNVKVVLV